jgi:hypothetical protein
MSSNFAFMPTGLSRAVTVGGAAPATVSLSLQSVGAAGTIALGTGTNYVPRAVRISNGGTAAVFINFGATAAAVSSGATIGFQVRNGTDVIVGTGGLPFMASACSGTNTVTLIVTPGEGHG